MPKRGARLSSDAIQVRSLTELDLDGIVRIGEKSRNRYEPDLWEGRVTYYLRRAPEGSVVAEIDGEVAGFMLGDIRSGEFGIEEECGWIEVMGVDPDRFGRGVGRALAQEMLKRYQARGVRKVRTMVDSSMPEVEAFFGRLGFEADTLRSYRIDLGTDPGESRT
jgi:ribosomal protein S18 acetylase RimI-like enzyme